MVWSEGTVVVLAIIVVVVSMLLMAKWIGGPMGVVPSLAFTSVTVKPWPCHCEGRYPDWDYHSELGCGETKSNYNRARDRKLRRKLSEVGWADE